MPLIISRLPKNQPTIYNLRKRRVYQGYNVIDQTFLVKITIGYPFGGQAFSEVIFFDDRFAIGEVSSDASTVAIGAKL